MNHKIQRMPGMGFNARPADPCPEPGPKPANEGAPTTPTYTGHTRKYEDSTSKSSRLLPFAREISAGLDGAMTRERLEAAVLGGFLTPAEAEQIARATGLQP